MIVLYAVIAAVLIAMVISGVYGAIWVPAFSKDINAALDSLKLAKDTTFIEFGCGDGRHLRKAAMNGSRVIGYEINPFIWKTAWLLSFRKNIKVNLGNAWKKSFSSADVVFAFLMPDFMERLGAKLSNELKPGSIIVTYAFPIPNMKHYRHEFNCYFYKV